MRTLKKHDDTMADVVWIILAAVLVIIGSVGTVAPVLPGVPVSWLGLLLLKFAPSVKDELSWTTIVVLGIVTLIVSLLDNYLPVWGTQKMGGNKQVVWGTAAGLLIGFFFGPLGIILGPFVGALAGSLLSGNKIKAAFKQASGAFVGYILGLIAKLVTAGFIIFFFIKALM
ncbi:DUF456 domain-containing protein [Limibacterium fermenti]|uniref:DUF456 domain-containing protein n=1 Tax=Limibacterium fermenti TaxID=3229863 RepID=UPI000E98F20C|nr:DUF456 domain-containing protein [Porphyromonadaceae bacterium]HBX47092.1 DUF456 domain-containing protein [Porphyromonadaceae bacterium]